MLPYRLIDVLLQPSADALNYQTDLHETCEDDVYLCILVSATLDHLLKQENTVLEHWTGKKRKLDQCQQYVLFEHSAKQVNVGVWFNNCWGSLNL